MRKREYIVLVIGLLLVPLGLWGSSPTKSFVFSFKQGSTSVDLSQRGNESNAYRLLGEFSGDRFLGVRSISVVGIVDFQGSYRANLEAARARAESVADLIEEKYSWIFVDGRMPISVAVEQGVGVARSVRVDLMYHETAPIVNETVPIANEIVPIFNVAPTLSVGPASKSVPLNVAPTLNVAPASRPTPSNNEEQGTLMLPDPRKMRTKPFGSEPMVFEPDKSLLVAIKTNLLFDLATAVNLEVEMPIGKRWSVLVSGVFPAFNYANRYCVRILETSLEGRFWFPKPAERLTGHFLGVYGHWVADYDLQWDRKGVMGSGSGVGFTYGYAHSIDRHFGLEYSLGIGGIYLQNKSYGVTPGYDYKHTPVTTSGWRILPTRLKVSLVWRIGGQKAVRK